MVTVRGYDERRVNSRDLNCPWQAERFCQARDTLDAGAQPGLWLPLRHVGSWCVNVRNIAQCNVDSLFLS